MKTLSTVSFSNPAIWPIVPVLCLLAGGCSKPADPGASLQRPAGDRPAVATVNYPLAYFAERLGQSNLNVLFPVPPNQDPAFWNPSPAEIRLFQKADLILLNGADYAQWVTRASLPNSRMINTTIDSKAQYIQEQETLTHSHGPDGAHSHGATAFTTWLDLTLAMEQARQVRQGLARLLPDNGPSLDSALARLQQDLMNLDAAFESTLASTRAKPWLASHPVYQYLARRYQLNLLSLHWEPEQAPSEKEWTQLETVLKDHPAPWMLWENTPRKETARRLEQMGIKVVVFHPCANRPPTGDFISVMRSNLDALQRAVTGAN